MPNIKKNIFLMLFLQTSSIFSTNSIIILYGCSSSGKTSIATELGKILPGQWKYIPSNQFKGSNTLFWQEINRSVANGWNVLVDTHSTSFLVDRKNDVHVLVALLYCSPQKLTEHVCKRNTDENTNTHRELKKVFKEFCNKYKPTNNSKHHIDVLEKSDIKSYRSISTYFAFKQIMKTYFTDNQKFTYIAPYLNSYDLVINTGKLSISESAQKIKNALLEKEKQY